MQNYFSTGEAARLLGVQPYRISYAHAVGQIPEPVRLLGKRAYRWTDLRALAEHFDVELRAAPCEPGREEDGRL